MKIQFNKYHPLKNPGKCNQCLGKNIYKAYRTICDSCAVKDGKKRCTKCGEEVENYATPEVRNNPEIGVKKKSPVMELVKTLKKKYQKTVYRKINTGVRIEYDEEKGIINEETKEVIISLDKIIKDDDEDDNENDIEDDKDEDEEKKDMNECEKNEENKENINGQEWEDINTNSKPEE